MSRQKLSRREMLERSMFATAAAIAAGHVIEPVAHAQESSAPSNTIRVARTGGDVAVFLPSAGSYGEVFSLIWEALFNEDLTEHSAAVEMLVAELPTVSRIEELGKRSGLVNINTQMSTELFEYENGTEFIESPLVADFLMPVWLETLETDEKERVLKQLAQLIDTDLGNISFRFTVKATLLTGEKN